MTAFLPPNLMGLFEARPPIPYLPPPIPLLVDKNEKLPEIRYGGVAEYTQLFEDPSETPAKVILETKEQKRERKRREKEELLAYKVEQGIAQWNPADNSKATEDPYKTLFVARVNYETSESKLKREFETYGKIKKMVMVHDENGKPRGYSFIEYSDKSEMHNAYKRADGVKVDGRRLIVDYERGRTQKSWLPRRLGGGKGDTRRARESRKTMEEREVVGEKDKDRNERDRERGGDREKRHRSRSRDRGERGERDRRDDRRDDRHERRDDRRSGYNGNRGYNNGYRSGGGGGEHRGGGGGGGEHRRNDYQRDRRY